MERYNYFFKYRLIWIYSFDVANENMYSHGVHILLLKTMEKLILVDVIAGHVPHP